MTNLSFGCGVPAGSRELRSSMTLAWVDDGPLVDAAVEWAYCRLSRSYGAVPIGVLADEIGWSRRHPISRFGQGSLPSRSRGCCASKG